MSTVNGYGNLKVKKIELANELIAHGTADDSSELVLSFANQSADRTLTFPAMSGNQSILHDGSAIAATQLNINGAGAASGGPADSDLMVIYDDSASANKKITMAQLDTYIGHNSHEADSITTAMLQDDCVTAAKLASNAVVNASVTANAAIAFSKLAALADGNMLVGSGSNVPTSVAMSGDATLANTGALTIANSAISTAKIANDAVDADKLASNAVVDASVASNAAIAFSKLAALDDGKILVGNGSNVAVKVPISGDATLANTGALTIANSAISTAKIAADAVDSSKLAAGACDATALGVTAGTCSASKALVADATKDVTGGRHFTITGNSQAGAFNVGGADSWRIRVSGGNLELQKHDGSAYVTKQVFTA